ncbi:hypothetical protein CCAX7_57180 [Capsulimonas corticalis]|uniref:Uncharacterized protein n=1 Tax=Capsulimonas corticalis TaxID=2219043 RepID=A0A402D0A2_9BACT|nr:hypothetical protein [Capsulimonas corticalis]BDI33667.1 hypothetical protein CCAX7_57180 [Capsulimonas corticalis]
MMGKRIPKAFLVVPLIAIGATALVLLLWRHPLNADTPAKRNAIYTAVFQKMLARRARPYSGLSVDGNDPDTAVMNQFRNDKRVILGSRITVGPTRAFEDRKTGASAEALSVDSNTLRWYGPASVSIEVDAHGSGSDGSHGTYYLVCKSGRWAVNDYRDSGIMF